jgi:hypothetical protein
MRPPSIFLVLTDDQDQMLGGSFPTAAGGATPMPRARALLADQGVTATNMFVHTPICCPSRAELLTGRYLHNLKVDPHAPWLPPGVDCMHVNGSKVRGDTFARRLREGAGALAPCRGPSAKGVGAAAAVRVHQQGPAASHRLFTSGRGRVAPTAHPHAQSSLLFPPRPGRRQATGWACSAST